MKIFIFHRKRQTKLSKGVGKFTDNVLLTISFLHQKFFILKNKQSWGGMFKTLNVNTTVEPIACIYLKFLSRNSQPDGDLHLWSLRKLVGFYQELWQLLSGPVFYNCLAYLETMCAFIIPPSQIYCILFF